MFINLLGCIFFMTAGVASFVPAGKEPGWILDLVNAHLWLGAFCFFLGAVLMMFESAQSAASNQPEQPG